MIAPTASDHVEEVYQVEMERLPIDSIDLHSCEAKTFVMSELVLANQFRIRHLDVIEEIRYTGAKEPSTTDVLPSSLNSQGRSKPRTLAM